MPRRSWRSAVISYAASSRRNPWYSSTAKIARPGFQLGAPGQDMGAGHRAKFLGNAEADKPTKVRQVILIGAVGAPVVEVGEPFRRDRHAGQLLELGGAQATFTGAAGHQLAHRMSGALRVHWPPIPSTPGSNGLPLTPVPNAANARILRPSQLGNPTEGRFRHPQP